MATSLKGRGFGFDLAREAGVPISHSIPLDGEGFYLAFDETMKNDFHDPDFRKKQTLVQKFKAKLFEGETIVPPIPAKARIARLLARLHSTKEGLEGHINPRLHILQDLRKHSSQFGMVLLPEGEQLVGIVQRERFVLVLPGMFARGQRFVVDPPTQRQRLHQLGALALGGFQAILERFHPRSSAVHSNAFLVFEVWLHDGTGRITHCRDEIRMGPQRRQSLFHMRKFLAKQKRAQTFDSLHTLMDSEVRVSCAQAMHRVRHHFTAQGLCNVIEAFLQALIHALHSYDVLNLRTKDYMVFAGCKA